LLSNALAAQGRNAEARMSIEQVTKAAIDSHNRRLELKAAVTAARIQAASDSASDVLKSVKRLHKIISVSNAVLEAMRFTHARFPALTSVM